MVGYFYIAGTLILTVYGQLVLKWRINSLGSLPDGSITKIRVILHSLADPYILSGFASAFIASLFWMAAMTKFEITNAYPFMSLAPAIVFILGIVMLNETFTYGKVKGLLFIISGIIITKFF